jgi:trk system potassium uptake protein
MLLGWRIKAVPFWVSFVTVLIVIYDLGFDQDVGTQTAINWTFTLTLFIGIIATVVRHLYKIDNPRVHVLLFDFISVLFFTILIGLYFRLVSTNSFFYVLDGKAWWIAAVFLVFVREFSALQIDFKRTVLNPAQLFIASFLAIIILGGFLLMLPKATHSGISLVDAMFTSTSAVCVTGLIVVDTGSYFTDLGQTIIAILIQVGGLGIMTFASYFSYFFRGSSSYENHLMLSDITSSKKIGEVFGILKKIIIVTFFIEGIGTILIYSTVDQSRFLSVSQQVFFSVFHSISGFCNAGFSTLPGSLYENAYRFNYSLHLIIAFLFITGGLGFPIVFNLVRYVKEIVLARVHALLNMKKYTHTPWLLNLNTRIVLITSLILTVVGTALFYAFEYNNTLAEHNGFGKVVTAFFGATTTRTAGFNTVDTSALRFPTIMIVFLLMWIGASPASTGGGIKTSTFAIATLNFVSLAKGKTRIEIFRREIADISVRRAFAIISLSLLVIGVAVFSIATFDSEKDLMSIAFECFSAYSTVGLSLGITGELSDLSKLVIIVVMFVGRVSMLSILIAILPKVKHKDYQYPGEEILIN